MTIGQVKSHPTHHLDDATLLSFAAGALPEALAAVAAQHVRGCAKCAATLRRMEAIGAHLFDTIEPVPLTKPAPTLALRLTGAAVGQRLNGNTPGAGAGRDGMDRAPSSLEALIGGALETAQWRRLGIGLWHARIGLSEAAGGELRLIKVAPGRRLPEHGHGGSELTLILDGAYTDEIGTFRVGDVADLDETVEHRPMADKITGCVCLIAFEHKARFKGFLPRLMQPLTGM